MFASPERWTGKECFRGKQQRWMPGIIIFSAAIETGMRTINKKNTHLEKNMPINKSL